MKRAVKISVIIPCFNHGQFLQESVGTVKKAMAERGDMELIVVDDGSTDERTCKEVEALEVEGIKTIRQENKGLASARNAGISASCGEYIFPLDADDRMRSEWIDRAVGILESDAAVGVVYGDAQNFGTETTRWVVGPFNADQMLYFNFIHASALYRRKVWEKNGGYDGTMPVMGLEDWDFWVGAFKHGWKFAYMPEIFFDYRRAQVSMITKAARSQYEVTEFVARKHAMVYRHAWLTQIEKCDCLLFQEQSLKWTLRNLWDLLKVKVLARVKKLGAKS